MSEPEFERWLKRSLEEDLGPLVASATLPPHAYARLTGRAGLFRPLRSRVFLGLVAASLATVAGGAVAATAMTGSSDPATWGQQVQAVVTQCKTQRATGERGIGHCVSASASQNGEAQNDQHASSARETAPQAAGGDSKRGQSEGSSKVAAERKTGDPQTSGGDETSHPGDGRGVGDPGGGSGRGRAGD